MYKNTLSFSKTTGNFPLKLSAYKVSEAGKRDFLKTQSVTNFLLGLREVLCYYANLVCMYICIREASHIEYTHKNVNFTFGGGGGWRCGGGGSGGRGLLAVNL